MALNEEALPLVGTVKLTALSLLRVRVLVQSLIIKQLLRTDLLLLFVLSVHRSAL